MLKNTKIIDFGKTRKLIDDYITNYNLGKPLKDKIRLTAFNMPMVLVNLYAAQLNKRRELSNPLRTNNIQLRTIMKISDSKTIRSAINKLKDAGIITDKIWHGSNSDFELFINPKILFIIGVNNVKTDQNPPNDEKSENPDNQFFKNSNKTKIQPYIFFQKDNNINNRMRKNVSSGENQEQNVSLKVPGHNPIFGRNILDCARELALKKTGNTEVKVATPLAGAVARSEEKRFSAAAAAVTPAPLAAPSAPDQKFKPGAGLENIKAAYEERKATIAQKPKIADPTKPEKLPLDESRFLNMVQLFWSFCCNTIYTNVSLTDSQIVKAKQILYYYFATATTNVELSRFYDEYCNRIMLAYKYAEKYKYCITIPTSYFDISNPNGFSKTKLWYLENKAQRAKNPDPGLKQILLKKCIKGYMREYLKPDINLKKIEALAYKYETPIRKMNDPVALDLFHKHTMCPREFKNLNNEPLFN